jgi:alpha-galactosidase
MSHTPKITIIGAGSVVWARDVLGDILSWPELKQSHLALMDIDPDRLAVSEHMAHRIAAALSAAPKITAHRRRKPALEDADYVLNAIQVGGFASTKIDFDIPRKYGLLQTIADTNGIGGIFRALRTIPVVVSMAREMEQLCPRAILINLANPMAMLCWAVARATGIQTVGLCHSVQRTAMLLAEFLGIRAEELVYHAAGVNHTTFFLKLEHRGSDVYPRLRKAMAKPEVWERESVRCEALRRLGYFVTESSHHFAEYVPWFIRRDRPELVERYGFTIEEYILRCEELDRRWARLQREMMSDDPIEVQHSDEYCAHIIHAHQTGEPSVIYGNVRNDGLIANLPEGCIVEVPCLVDRNGIQPCHVGELPPQLAGLLRSIVSVHELTVEAFFSRRRDHIYQAALLDAHTAAELTVDDIYAMVDELFDAHGKMVPRLR